jgi:hypothetical protein
MRCLNAPTPREATYAGAVTDPAPERDADLVTLEGLESDLADLDAELADLDTDD